MKIFGKSFIKKWPDGSRLKVAFTTVGGPIIVKDFPVDSPYGQEIDSLADDFYFKKFDETKHIIEKENFIELDLDD